MSGDNRTTARASSVALQTVLMCLVVALVGMAVPTRADAVAPPAPLPSPLLAPSPVPLTTSPKLVLESPSLSVEPVSGPPGTTVVATATGYGSCPETGGDDVGPGPVEFLWDAVDPLDVVPVSESSASTTFLVPEASAIGGHTVVSRCAADGSLTVRTGFTVEPPVVLPVVVPDVVGLSLEAAADRLDAEGLALGDVSGEGDEVGTQTPAAGTEVDPGSPVDVTLAAAPATLVPVPDLIGLSLAEAREELADDDLRLGSVAGDGETVEDQTPLPGAEVPPGTTVGIVLGPAQPALVAVPDLVGQDVADVPALLAERGLELGQQTGDGDVVALQRPAPGTLVLAGSAVSISVEPGVPPSPLVEVPDLTGMDVDEARDALLAAGLALGTVPGGDGDVSSQQPAPGTLVPTGSPVTVSLQPGPPPWLPVAVVVLVLAAGAGLATYRSLRPRRDRRWLRRHVRLAPGMSSPPSAAAGDARDAESPPTVVVRLEPRPDAGTLVLEEVPP